MVSKGEKEPRLGHWQQCPQQWLQDKARSCGGLRNKLKVRAEGRGPWAPSESGPWALLSVAGRRRLDSVPCGRDDSRRPRRADCASDDSGLTEARRAHQ